MLKRCTKIAVIALVASVGMAGCTSGGGGAVAPTGHAPSAKGVSPRLAEKAAPVAPTLAPSPTPTAAARPGVRLPDSAKHRYDASPDHGILTAGSFDDRLDLDGFQRYLSANGGDLKQWSSFSRLDFRKRPLADAYSGRYSGLQLAFVLDATGSMGDELEYLKREFQGITARIQQSFPGVQKSYGLVVYRDEGDEFVSKVVDFTSSADKFQRHLDRQVADGGGDYPEAVHTALKNAATRLRWDRSPQTAKMIFFVADAPPHDAHLGDTFEQISALERTGVAIYPVAASGVGDLAELVMRVSAAATGGQYIFLTDDSGVGLSHAEPKFPCYRVEMLNRLMVRMVTDRLGHVRTQPSQQNVIRTVGNPNSAACRASGQLTQR